MSFLLLIMRLFLGGVFVYSGWQKLTAPVENFMTVIEGYQFLKPPFISIAANLVPWFELVFGSFLMLGFLTRTSATFLGVLLTIFVGLLIRSLWLHLPVLECGCFGSGITLAPWQALILDFGLLVVSFVMVVFRPRVLSLDQKLHQ